MALARLPGHLREAGRQFLELTGFTAVASFRSPGESPGGPSALTPPVHPQCAALLREMGEDVPCEEEWQTHLRTGLRTHSVQRHKCPLGLHCCCVPIYYGGTFAGIAKCVVGPGTSDRRFSRAVQLLELTVSKACQDFRVSDLSEQLEAARDQVVRLRAIRNGTAPAPRARFATVARSKAPVGASAGRSLIDRTLDYILQHYLEPGLTLAAISRELGVTERYLTHLFTRTVGQRMHAYIVQLRIQHACRLILLTDKSIKEVAYESGFSRIEVFRRAFRNCVGIAPAVYRRAFMPV